MRAYLGIGDSKHKTEIRDLSRLTDRVRRATSPVRRRPDQKSSAPRERIGRVPAPRPRRRARSGERNPRRDSRDSSFDSLDSRNSGQRTTIRPQTSPEPIQRTTLRRRTSPESSGLPRPPGLRSSCEPNDCPLLRSWYQRVIHEYLTRHQTDLAEDLSNISDGHASEIRVVHQPLAPWQTRLIELLGFDDYSAVPEVRLFPVDFADMNGVGVTGTSDVVTYTAVSHVWGSSTSESVITCNGKSVIVPSSLVRILTHLCKETQEKYVWIDSLCINQEDMVEKSVQVRNMLRIFEKADKVIAWLDHPHALTSLPLTEADLRHCVGLKHKPECCLALAHQHRTLIQLASAELWSRTWCRQEVFAAAHLTLSGPSFRVPDFDLDRLSESLKITLAGATIFDAEDAPHVYPKTERHLVPGPFSIMASHYQHGGTDRYTYEPPTSKTRYTRHWMQHLRDGTAFKVTDERDRVYGIFGMISSATNRMHVEYRADIKPQDFPIDYSKSVSEVYQDVIKFLINTDRNLDCLVVVEDRRTRFMSKDLPSWVTDWRQHQPRSLPNLPPDRDNELRQYGQPPRQDLAAVGRLMLEGVVEFEVLTLSAAKVSDWWDVDGLPIKQVAEFVPRVLQRTWALDGALDTICSSYMKCASHMDNPCSSNIGELGPWYYVPKTARIGDIVVSLSGSSHRFVLREARAIARFSSPTTPCFKLVGLAFPAQESWPSRPTGVLQTFILI